MDTSIAMSIGFSFALVSIVLELKPQTSLTNPCPSFIHSPHFNPRHVPSLVLQLFVVLLKVAAIILLQWPSLNLAKRGRQSRQDPCDKSIHCSFDIRAGIARCAARPAAPAWPDAAGRAASARGFWSCESLARAFSASKSAKPFMQSVLRFLGPSLAVVRLSSLLH